MDRLRTSFEGMIVELYDGFFLSDSKTEQDVDFVDNLIKKHNKADCDVLDIGCGTGFHDELLAIRQNSVHGIDLSGDMIEYAKKNHLRDNITYEKRDIRMWDECEKKWDAVISLSHVIGYQLDNDSLRKYFVNIFKKVGIGGVFVFNFYNQPALFLNTLSPRNTKKEIDGTMVNRVSSARLRPDLNCLQLDYYYIVEKDKKTNCFEIHESMRYFSTMELDYILLDTGFRSVSFSEWGTGRGLEPTMWNGCCVAVV